MGRLGARYWRELCCLIGALFIGILIGLNGAGEGDSRKQVGLERYNRLPISARTALENRDLEGVTFFITISPEVTDNDFLAYLNQRLIGNGAKHAKDVKSADLHFTVSPPIKPGFLSTAEAHVEAANQDNLVLLSGNYENTFALGDDLYQLITDLATERRSQVLAQQR